MRRDSGIEQPSDLKGRQVNRLVLETAALYSHEQGLMPQRVRLAQLVAASTLEQ